MATACTARGKCGNEYQIGLTDLVKYDTDVDRTLTAEMYDVIGLESRILTCGLEFVAFSGKAAVTAYFGLLKTSAVSRALQSAKIGQSLLIVFPSTSGDAGLHWDERVWHEFAAITRVS